MATPGGDASDIELQRILTNMREHMADVSVQETSCVRLVDLTAPSHAERSRFIALLGDLGAHEVLLDVMSAHTCSVAIATSTCTILGFMASNLVVKGKLLSLDSLQRVAAVMKSHSQEAEVQTAACVAVAELCTVAKPSDLSKELMRLVVTAMGSHAECSVLTAACNVLAIFARSKEIRDSCDITRDDQTLLDAVCAIIRKWPQEADLQAAACKVLHTLLEHADDKQQDLAVEVVLSTSMALSAPHVQEAACNVVYRALEKRDRGGSRGEMLANIIATGGHEKIKLAQAASDATDNTKTYAKAVLERVEKKSAALEQARGATLQALSQVEAVMGKAGTLLRAVYSVQMAIRSLPRLIGACKGGSAEQGKLILRLLEKVALDASFESAVKRSMAKLFDQYKASLPSFIDACFDLLLSPVIMEGLVSSPVKPMASLTLFHKTSHRDRPWKVGVLFSDASELSLKVSETNTDGTSGASGISPFTYSSQTFSTTLPPAFNSCSITREEKHIPNGLTWILGHGGRMRCVAQAQCEQVVVESRHNYEDGVSYGGVVEIEGAASLRVSFDARCRTESGCDYLSFFKDASMSNLISRHDAGRGGSNFADFTVPGGCLYFHFESDSSGNTWGWKFTVSKGGEKDGSDSEPDDTSAEGISKLTLAQEMLTCAMSSPRGARQLSQPHRFKLICQVCATFDDLCASPCPAA